MCIRDRTTAISMGEHYGAEMDYCFNRKEIKDHAESGLMVGKKLNPNDRVVLIDDVVTAGLSIEESIAILKSQGNPDIVGVIIAVDRMEKSNDGDNVIQKIKDKNGLSIKPIVSIEEVLKTVEEMHLLSKGEWEKIYAYRYRYGV
ncbi:MAG: orotate phosphoribosyltransferase, partial [Alphaproteobacteria bacterium]|nr:orotate phosphoribosyltransferase [Alphaproteobacteria bacterium]